MDGGMVEDAFEVLTGNPTFAFEIEEYVDDNGSEKLW